MTELTPEEIKNGWTEEALEKYLAEREEGAQIKIFRPRAKPLKQNNSYDPFRFRR